MARRPMSRGDPGSGGGVPAGPASHPAGRRPALQPARYDAARTIAALSTRLHQQVDLTTLTAELVSGVDETMQPTTAWLWLRPTQARPEPDRTVRRYVGVDPSVLTDWRVASLVVGDHPFGHPVARSVAGRGEVVGAIRNPG
jgi:hypothetical protein